MLFIFTFLVFVVGLVLTVVCHSMASLIVAIGSFIFYTIVDFIRNPDEEP